MILTPPEITCTASCQTSSKKQHNTLCSIIVQITLFIPQNDVAPMSNNSTKPRLLLIGDGAIPTGFSRVLLSIFEHLTDPYDIFHLATGYQGDPHSYLWDLYPAHLGGDQFGIGRLPYLIEQLQPNVVFSLHDLWVQAEYMKVLRQYTNQLKVILYCPVDSAPIMPHFAEGLIGADMLAVFNPFSQEHLVQTIMQLMRQNPALPIPSIKTMGLGVNTDLFYPMSPTTPQQQDRTEARKMLFGDVPGIADLFIVLNANRNQPRKRVDLTVAGFAQFAANKPDSVRLFLHMGKQDTGWNVHQLARRYGIEDRLILSGEWDDLPQLTSEQLNLIYNVCDVGINTSLGESWGLTSFEHAATGAAQIVPDHTAPGILWKNAAELMSPSVTLTNTGMWDEHYVMPETIAAALERVYADVDYRTSLAKKGYEMVTSPQYQWRNIAAQWNEIIQSVL